MNQLISIVIPIYNVESKLERCLNSIKCQTYPYIEVLLVNDGSPDNSKEICMNYVNVDSRFVYFEKENGGLSSARNFGIKEAKGKYIYFIDSDDYCEDDLLKKLISGFNNDIQIVASGYQIEYPYEKIIVEKKSSNSGEMDIKNFVLELDAAEMFNVVWNKLYILDIIKKYNISFEENMMPGEDIIFNCEYLKHVKKGNIINENLYHYMRENEETLVNKYDKDLIDKVSYFLSKKEELLKNVEIDNSMLQDIIAKTTINYTFSCLTNLFRKNNTEKISEKYFEIKEIISMSRKNNYHLLVNSNDKNIKLFIWFLKINMPKLMIFLYSTLFFCRNRFSKLYLSFRAFNLKNIK